MKARDIMTPDVLTIEPETQVAEIARILSEHQISGVPVVEGGRVVGIVSEGDLIYRSEIGTHRREGSWWLRMFRGETPADFVKTHAKRARDVMTREVVYVGEDASLAEIADLFESRRIKRVPVVQNGKLVGIISRANLVRALASAGNGAVPPHSASDRDIREALLKTLAERPWWNKYRTTVNVIDGVVHYWGIAQGTNDRSAARVAAEGIPGVRGVEDHRVSIDRAYAE